MAPGVIAFTHPGASDAPLRRATLLGGDRFTPRRTVTVAIAHNSSRRQAALRTALERGADIEVVGEAASGDGALALASLVRPDVVVMDVDLDGLGCVKATRSIRTETTAAVLLMSNGEPDGRVLAALQAGAGGVTLEDSAPSHLIRAVTLVGRGRPLRRRHRLAPNPQEEHMVTPKVIEIRRGSAHGATLRTATVATSSRRAVAARREAARIVTR
jgi:DNA-binding NarL/FixJ family response regulator